MGFLERYCILLARNVNLQSGTSNDRLNVSAPTLKGSFDVADIRNPMFGV